MVFQQNGAWTDTEDEYHNESKYNLCYRLKPRVSA